jgi:hypothetical protein
MLGAHQSATRALEPGTQSRASILTQDVEQHASPVGEVDGLLVSPAVRASLKTQWASPLSGEQAPTSLLREWNDHSYWQSAKSSDPRSTAADRLPGAVAHGPQDRAGMTDHSSSSRTDQAPLVVALGHRSGGVGRAPAFDPLWAAEGMESDDGVGSAIVGARHFMPPATGDGRPGRQPLQRSLQLQSPADAAGMLRSVPELDNAAAREQLAEAMRRILTDEARRHGIDV